MDFVIALITGFIALVAIVLAIGYYHKWKRARDYNTKLIMNCNDVLKRTQALLAAKILDGLNAGLPSSYYEAMENKNPEEVADIVINRIKNTKIQKDE